MIYGRYNDQPLKLREGEICMNGYHEERKELFINLYKSMELMRNEIEASLDALAEENTEEFNIALLNIMELSIQILRGDY